MTHTAGPETPTRPTRERRRTEANQMLRLVLDTFPVRIFWKDPELRYLGCNRLFAVDAGYASPEELLGKTDYDLAWRDQAERYQADDRAVLESGQPRLSYEEPQTSPSGEQLWLRTSKVPLRDLNGQVIGILGTYEDITAQRRTDEQRRLLETRMREAQKLESLGILAGGIAHDFNNLLMGILGNADLAMSQLPAEAPGRMHVERIRTAALRASELTSQMLAYSGKGRFRIEPLDLNRLVTEMEHLLRTVLSKKTEVRFELSPNLPAIDGDAGQLRQVVMNLILNASEALGGRPGVVRVVTAVFDADPEALRSFRIRDDLAVGRYVRLDVVDEGCGMDRDTLRRLFDPFFTTKATGRGLGLAAAQGIVLGHHGGIRVQSTPGEGTTFRVLLPASAASRTPDGTGAASPEVESSHGTVLVVDDDEGVRAVTSDMLRHAGYEVWTAVDGLDGVERILQHGERISLVVLDMTMPRMGGEEAFQEMRRLRPDLRVILSSGYSEQETTERLADMGFSGFIQKPYRQASLLELVRRVLTCA
jgi:two-component system, cell cycle sensor histidine kinase and response regulator CckA